jgi:hypothetical protein
MQGAIRRVAARRSDPLAFVRMQGGHGASCCVLLGAGWELCGLVAMRAACMQERADGGHTRIRLVCICLHYKIALVDACLRACMLASVHACKRACVRACAGGQCTEEREADTRPRAI